MEDQNITIEMNSGDTIALTLDVKGLVPDRRERIATAILAGMWANPEVWKEWLPAKTRMRALEEADALIAELEKEKK